MENELNELLSKEERQVGRFYMMKFHDHVYYFSTMGCRNPEDLLMMFGLEKQLREDWWNVQDGDVVVDVGAAHGSYTLPALACGAGLVIAFEPSHEETFDLLSNLFVNKWFRRCIVLPVLVGNSETVEDYDPVCHQGGPKHRHTERRMMTSLDSTLDGVSKLDWIKVDADGMELEVFKGAMETIKKFRPRIINENHEALEPGVSTKIREIMVPLDYVEENRCENPSTNENWSLWTPKEKA